MAKLLLELQNIQKSFGEKTVLQVRILNSNGYELPMTGGPGVGRLTAIGLLLTLGAGFALLRRRRVRL